MRAIAAHAALVLGGLAALGALPAVIGILRGEDADPLGLTVVFVSFVCGALLLALREERGRRLGRFEMLALLGIIWLLLPIVSALPLWASGRLSGLNAWFEGVSAVTTTGATLFAHVDPLPRNIVLWLALSQWYGGLVTLVGILYVVAPTGAGGLRAPLSADLDRTADTPGGATLDMAIRQVAPLYLLASILCVAALLICAVPVLDALCLAATTLSTGGLVPRTAGISAYDSPAVELVLIVFMLIGATSVLWLRAVSTGRWRALTDEVEPYWMYGSAVALGLVFAVLLKTNIDDPQPTLAALRHGLFTASSLITTTGFDSRAGSFTLLPIAPVAFAMCLGGCSFSTAGGMKLYRVGAMVLQSVRELTRLLYPHGMRPATIGRRPYDMQMMKGVWVGFAIYCLAFIGLLVAVAPAIGDFEGAFIAAAAALTNTGPVYVAGWPGDIPWPTWIELPAHAKVVLGFGMILGRVEIIVILGLALRGLWRA